MIRPFVGIIFFLHLLLVIFSYILTLPRRLTYILRGRYIYLALFFSLVLASGVLFVTGSIIVWAAGDGTANIYHLPSFHSCRQFARAKPNSWQVIVRIDDIQAHAMPHTTRRMIKEAMAREIPLVLGVIPKRLERDKKLIAWLRRYQCNLEIALHGWENSVDGNYNLAEFGQLDFEEALFRIKRGRSVLESIFNKKVQTFIPPNNHYSFGTALALVRAEVPIVSSEGNGFFDYNASTFDFDKEELEPAEHVIKDCYQGYKEKGLCVIMLHPQDFMTGDKLDENKFRQFVYLLDGLQKAGAQFTTFADLLKTNPEFSYLYIKELNVYKKK